MRPSPSRTASVRLPLSRSVGMSRRLLATRMAEAMAPTPTAPARPAPVSGVRLGVERAERGHEPEEDEDVELAEAAVAVGVVPAGVAPGGHDGQRPEGHHDPGLAERDQRQSHEGGEPEERERHQLDVVGVGEVLADEPHRSDPVGVGAADAVGVVVGVVDADLQPDRHQQRQQGQAEVGLLEGGGGGGADDDGGDCGGQGARAGAGDPLGRGGHSECCSRSVDGAGG